MLDKMLEWCSKHELYAILDLHAVQGWQNVEQVKSDAGVFLLRDGVKVPFSQI